MHRESRRLDELSIWDTRRAPVWVIVAALAVNGLAAYFFNFVVGAHHWLGPLALATQGLIQPTWIMAPTLIIIMIVGLIIHVGGLRWADVGFIPSRIWPAVIFTVALWAMVNGGLAIMDLINHLPMTLDDSWAKLGIPRKAGIFIGQIFGNTPIEEILFRGFLLVQLALIWRPLGQTKALVIALIASQLIFALMHIPFLIVQGHHFPEICFGLTELFIMGSIFAIIYLATNNLFIAMGTHALANQSMQVPSGSTSVFEGIDVFSCIALAASLLWWWRGGLVRQKGKGLTA